MRDWRKARSETEGVPVYTLFTNAQLAEIVKKKVGTIAELETVTEVGKSRIENYGESLLTVCRDFIPPEGK